jgi:hypothetical protein
VATVALVVIGAVGIWVERVRRRDRRTHLGPRRTPDEEVSRAGSLAAREVRDLIQIPSSAVIALTENRTAVQAAPLLKSYEGKWTRVSGTVDDVHDETWTGKIIVQLSRGKGELSVNLSFAEAEWRDQLLVLRPGERVAAVGRVTSVNRFWVNLESCELELITPSGGD